MVYTIRRHVYQGSLTASFDTVRNPVSTLAQFESQNP